MDDTKVTIVFDLDNFSFDDSLTSGQWEDIQEGKFKGIRELIEKFAVVEGLPPGVNLTTYLRNLKPSELSALGVDLVSSIAEKQNPSKNGKNSIGGSRNTLKSGRVSRR